MVLLGGKYSARKPVLSGFDQIALSDEGITRKAIESLTQRIGVSQKAFAESIMIIERSLDVLPGIYGYWKNVFAAILIIPVL